jgi:hypothetical protein
MRDFVVCEIHPGKAIQVPPDSFELFRFQVVMHGQ